MAALMAYINSARTGSNRLVPHAPSSFATAFRKICAWNVGRARSSQRNIPGGLALICERANRRARRQSLSDQERGVAFWAGPVIFSIVVSFLKFGPRRIVHRRGPLFLPARKKKTSTTIPGDRDLASFLDRPHAFALRAMRNCWVDVSPREIRGLREKTFLRSRVAGLGFSSRCISRDVARTGIRALVQLRLDSRESMFRDAQHVEEQIRIGVPVVHDGEQRQNVVQFAVQWLRNVVVSALVVTHRKPPPPALSNSNPHGNSGCRTRVHPCPWCGR